MGKKRKVRFNGKISKENSEDRIIKIFTLSLMTFFCLLVIIRSLFASYSVQVGAFKSYNNAVDYYLNFAGQDYQILLSNENLYYKIKFGSFESHKAAEKFSEQLNSKFNLNTYITNYPKKSEILFKNFESNKKKTKNAVNTKLYKESKTNIINNLSTLSKKPTSNIEKIINIAKTYLNVPYEWGGDDKYGVDCSGLIHLIFKKNNIIIPRITTEQYKIGKKIRLKKIKKGDLIFFSTYKKGPSHVGLYIGYNRFIHASVKSGKVIISRLTNPYYSKRIISVKRITS